MIFGIVFKKNVLMCFDVFLLFFSSTPIVTTYLIKCLEVNQVHISKEVIKTGDAMSSWAACLVMYKQRALPHLFRLPITVGKWGYFRGYFLK